MNLQVRSVPLLLIPLLFFSLLFVRKASADPVADPTLGDWFDTEWILVFVGCSLLETAVISLFLSHREGMRTRIAVWILVFVLNLITMFVLNFLDYYYVWVLFYPNELFFFIALELTVIMIESASLILFFRYHSKRGLLKGRYSVRYVLMIFVVSNIVSFFSAVAYTSIAT